VNTELPVAKKTTYAPKITAEHTYKTYTQTTFHLVNGDEKFPTKVITYVMRDGTYSVDIHGKLEFDQNEIVLFSQLVKFAVDYAKRKAPRFRGVGR
jgi:hypothetical protein